MEGPPWFHCSRCFRGADAAAHPTDSFHVTSCAHLLCAPCFADAARGAKTCPVCRAACSTLPLNAQLPPDLRRAFADPQELAQDLLNALQFQRAHQDRFTMYLKELVAQQRDVLLRAKAELVLVKELHAEIARLKAENERLTGVPTAPFFAQGTARPSIFERMGTTALQGAPALTSFPAAVPSTGRASAGGDQPPSTPLGPSRITLRTPPRSDRTAGGGLATLGQHAQAHSTSWASTLSRAPSATPRTAAQPPAAPPPLSQQPRHQPPASPAASTSTRLLLAQPAHPPVVHRQRSLFPGSVTPSSLSQPR